MKLKLALLAFFAMVPALAQMPDDLTAFSEEWAALTPNDDATLTRQPRALYICEDGDLVVTTWRNPTGAETTFPVVAGQILPISPGRIKESSTTSCIIALY